MEIRTGEDLARAIAEAEDGTTLTLAVGMFRLPPGCTVTRAIALVGQGTGETRLVGQLTIATEVTLSDMAIAGTGQGPVIQARSGRLALARCRLSDGAVGLRLDGQAIAELDDVEIVGHRGDGVRVGGRARAMLSRCLIERNGGDGVAVGGAGDLVIENSLVLDNRGCGIAYRDGATGEAYGNLVQGHRGADVVVAGLAVPRLAENTVPEREEAMTATPSREAA